MALTKARFLKHDFALPVHGQCGSKSPTSEWRLEDARIPLGSVCKNGFAMQ